VTVLAAAGLAAGGCGSSKGHASTASCFAKNAATGTTGSAPGGPASQPAAAGWTLPGGNLANTRDVASAITSSNVAELGVAWCVPVESTGSARAAGLADGYATTPVVVNGVVYTQDQESNVMAIRLATGKVLWTHNYDSLNGGPDGVNVAGGTVYAATDSAAVALSAATGRQLWSRTLTRNDHEGIDMAPGYNHGIVYVSTVPVNPGKGQYLGGAKGILRALNAATPKRVQVMRAHPAEVTAGHAGHGRDLEAHGHVGDAAAVDPRARARRVVARPQRLCDPQELEDVQRAGREVVEEPEHVVAARVDRRTQRRIGAFRGLQDIPDLHQP
jgi:glucose dehydrogenase